MESLEMRRLTIGDGVRANKYSRATIFPVIRLQGKWLEDAGFLPGQSVYLFIDDGIITLMAKPGNEQEAKAIDLYNALN